MNPVWLPWGQLVRLPAVFSVIAQITAAFLIAGGGSGHVVASWPRLALALVAGVAIYWAGMILNDIWDYDEDLRDRPSRPLPSGQISLPLARKVAFGLLCLSITTAALSGAIPVAGFGLTIAPAVVGSVLALCVVLYDGPLKQYPIAPLIMGLCRGLCFLLGAAPLAPSAGGPFSLATAFTPQLLGLAAGFTIYITGVTMISRLETGFAGTGRVPLAMGLVVSLIGAAGLALVPRLALDDAVYRFRPDATYLLLIALITLPLATRGLRTLSDPDPKSIQQLVRSGILNVTPYSAALALIAAGPVWGVAVLMLTAAAIWTATRMRVT